MRGTRLYVYALLGSGARAAPRRGTRIEIIPVGGLFAAVEPLERLADPPALSEAALRRQHQIVVALSHATDAILPVRFGALLDLDELVQLVRLRRGVLRRALQRVRGHDQMTLRVFGSRSPRRARQSPVAAESASGRDYLLGRAAASRAALTPAGRAILEAVRPLVSAQRIDAGRGGVQATINHLVTRGSGPRYRRLVAASIAKMTPTPAVTVSGPWPPFAFAPDIWSSDPEGASVLE